MTGQKKPDSNGSSLSIPCPSSLDTFSKILSELRKPRFKTQAELAKVLSGRKVEGTISRGYVSALESGAKKPSLELLSQLCEVLLLRDNPQPTHSELAELTKLIFAALDLPLPTPVQSLSLKDELERQKQDWVRSIWIISDTLGENRYDEILATTVLNLNREQPVEYKYFFPRIEEWEICHERLSVQVDRRNLSGFVTAIRCPSLMCVPRIRIMNPGADVGPRESEGTITIGAIDQLGLYRLRAAQIETIVDRLTSVLTTIDKHKEKSPVVTREGTFEQLFP